MRQLHPFLFGSLIGLIGLIVLVGETAHADKLGGFSADETRYLVGRDTICIPISVTPGATTSAAPACQGADASTVSSMKFRRGTSQHGRDAAFDAEARGRKLTLRARRGDETAELTTWTSVDPIARVVGVYTSSNARLVAVEYEVRFGGRLRVEVVGFAVPASDSTAPDPGLTDQPRTASPATSTSPSTSPSSGPATPERAPEMTDETRASLEAARRAAKRKRHARAIEAYNRVLSADPGHAESRFGLARALAARGKTDDAIGELEHLARSRREDAPRWRVQARHDKAFAKLRANKRFRKATGIDRSPDQPQTLYERLLGFTDTWEQSETTCEAPEVGLSMDRLDQEFKLHITSRCGGYKDTMRLRGHFRLSGADRVELVLPNKGAKDDTLSCVMQTCSGEDCLKCVVDMDLHFVLRPVRR